MNFRYAEDPNVAVKFGDDGLEGLLADPNIEAICNVLPVHIALEVFVLGMCYLGTF